MILISVLVAAVLVMVRGEGPDHDKVVMCYWGTWANYRPKEGKFVSENVDGSLCTHLIYSFAGLDTSKWAIKTLDAWLDLEDNYGLGGFKKATDLKIKYPHLKVMIAIGGWNEGSTKYSQMAGDEGKRAKFVNSTVEFLTKHNFDGLDLDWEYPAKRGGSAKDKKSFIQLVKDLKSAFAVNKFLLTAAIGAGKATIDISYDVPAMYKYLDYVNVMCYDYHGKWDKKTGHNAPLRPRPDETGQNIFLNLEYSIDYLIKKGAKPEKTILGVPLYGRSFLLANPAKNRMGDPAKSTSFAGPFTREQGFLGYNEICKELTAPGSNWTIVWEKCHQAPYMFRGDRWVSYDNERSVRLKADLAFEKKLGGVMVWSIETDDFTGACDGTKYPLLKSLNNALSSSNKGGVTEEETKCNPAEYTTRRPRVTTTKRTKISSKRTKVTRKPWSPSTLKSKSRQTPTSSSQGVCKNQNGPNHDPADCSKFYLCANGVPHALVCQSGTLFSAVLMTCDHADNVQCSAKDDTGNAVDNNNLIEEHDTDAELYTESPQVNIQPSGQELSGERIAIIILSLVILILCVLLCWCSRTKIMLFAEPYIAKHAPDSIRRPSTVGLLKTCNMSKLGWGWAWQNKMSSTEKQPSAPPMDYPYKPGHLDFVTDNKRAVADLPSQDDKSVCFTPPPGTNTNNISITLPGAPVPPPRRKRNIAVLQSPETSPTALPDIQSNIQSKIRADTQSNIQSDIKSDTQSNTQSDIQSDA